MRIFAFLSLSCLAIVAFRSQNSGIPQSSSHLSHPVGQAKNILFQTADGGETWNDMSLGLPEKFVANSAFAQDDEVYLADRAGVLYHKSAQVGSTWQREEISGIFPDAGGLFQEEIVVNGIFAGSKQPYASVYANGFFRRSPGTGKWESLASALPDKRVYSMVENSDGAIFVGGESGIYKTTDDGKSWKHVYFEGFANQLVAANGVLLAGAGSGLIRSSDGGEHWDTVLPNKGAQYVLNVNEGAFVAIRQAWGSCSTAASPLQSSTDAGLSWQPIYTGPTEFKGVYDLKKAGKYIFCCHKDGVSRSKDGGSSWETVREALDPNKPFRYELLVSGENVFAVVLFAGC